MVLHRRQRESGLADNLRPAMQRRLGRCPLVECQPRPHCLCFEHDLSPSHKRTSFVNAKFHCGFPSRRGPLDLPESTTDQESELTRNTRALAPDFKVLGELGRGGMGVVYLAVDVNLDREVAIKVLPPHLAQAPGVRERFLREARTAAKLSHPNIVPVYRADEMGGVVFFVMRHVDGESLADRLASSGPLTPLDATRLLQQVAS